MKVNIKQLDVKMELKNNGMELQVCDNDGKQLGDLYVAKGGLTWCKGKTSREKGRKINWQAFIHFMEEDN